MNDEDFYDFCDCEADEVYTVTEHPQHQAERLAREAKPEIDYLAITRSFG